MNSSTTYLGVPTVTSSNCAYIQSSSNSNVDPDIQEFKRLMAWKNLKIKSISINSESITIEGTRNKKTYFVVVSKTSISIFDSKMKELDRIEIPVPFDDISTWGKKHVGVPQNPYWTDTAITINYPQWVTTTTCDNTSIDCYKVSFE